MFARVDAQSVQRAEQDDFVPDLDARQPGHIHQGQIHGDTAHNRRIVLADNYPSTRRQRPIQPISITNRQHSNTRGRFGDVNSAVA